MAAKQDSPDKTEKPTSRRLREARKQGDVPRSKDLTSTVGLLAWLGLFWLMMPVIGQRFEALIALIFASMDKPFEDVIGSIAAASLETLLLLTLPLLLAAACVGLLA